MTTLRKKLMSALVFTLGFNSVAFASELVTPTLRGGRLGKVLY